MGAPDGIGRRKAAMGYVVQRARPACGNCAFVTQRAPTQAVGDQHAYRCSRGGFGTYAFSICNAHVPRTS